MTPIQAPSNTQTAPSERTVTGYPANAQIPLVDQLVLERLKEELDENGEGYTGVFVANFIACLPRRIERLRLALTTGDWDGSFDAVLSLKTSSHMVGAEQLAFLATKLETEIRSDATLADVKNALPQKASAFLGPISQCSRKTVYSLTDQCPTGSSDG
jgi:histidine phosphotransfer protein HptB